MLNINDIVRVTKGSEKWALTKGTFARVDAITELGPDYSHSVRVRLFVTSGTGAGRVLGFYARHRNRLDVAPFVDINLNDGNPLNTLKIAKFSGPRSI